MPGQYWGAKLGRHAEEDFYLEEYRQYLGRDARRRMPLAAYNSNNVYPKGALVLRDAQAAPGPGAVLGGDPTDISPSTPYGNATSDDLRQAVLDATGRESRLVLVAVDLPGRAIPSSTCRRPTTLRARGAHPDRAADAAGHRDGRSRQRAIHYAPGLPCAGGDPGGDGRGRRGDAGGDRPAGAGGADRGGPRCAHHGRVRRRERRAQDARLPAADALARHPAAAAPRSLEPELGHRSARLANQRHRWRRPRWRGRRRPRTTTSPAPRRRRRWAASPASGRGRRSNARSPIPRRGCAARRSRGWPGWAVRVWRTG